MMKLFHQVPLQNEQGQQQRDESGEIMTVTKECNTKTQMVRRDERE